MLSTSVKFDMRHLLEHLTKTLMPLKTVSCVKMLYPLNRVLYLCLGLSTFLVSALLLLKCLYYNIVLSFGSSFFPPTPSDFMLVVFIVSFESVEVLWKGFMSVQ